MNITQSQIDRIRQFNRFYTQFIGVLDKHILNSAYSLPEARILFEIYQQPGLNASDLISILNIDKGYLSRILKRFEKDGFLQKKVASHDKRVIQLMLSDKGLAEFKTLDRASSEQIQKIFEKFTFQEIQELIRQMQAIKDLITKKM